MFYEFAKILCKIFLRIFLAVEVVGMENIPSQGAFILAGNHASYLDPVVFGIACPRPLCYLAKSELFENSFFGWLLRKVNAYPLKRNTSDVGAIKQALRQLKGGKGIILFPEGTRGSGSGFKKGMAGVGFLARKANVPVIPAFVKGTDEALPKGAKFIKRSRIKVIFGQPIHCHDQNTLTDEDMAVAVMKAIVLLQSAP